jgi:hypothetical protein
VGEDPHDHPREAEWRRSAVPESQRELVNAAGGVLIDALERIDEVVVGIDVVQSAGDD